MCGTSPDPLLGRDALLETIDGLIRRRQNVLLFGPADVGKTALIGALHPRDLVVLDPFERVTPHLAARIRRAIDHDVVHLAATRSLDRRHLGAVRRIAFWFTTIRVPPLSLLWMRRLVRRECLALHLADELGIPRWTSVVLRLARGRPGVALAIVQAAASIRAEKGSIPSPAAAYIEARIRRAGVSVGMESRPSARLDQKA